MRPLHIALDIDGVIYDWVGEVRKHFASTFGLDPADLVVNEYAFWDGWGFSADEFWPLVHDAGITTLGSLDRTAVAGVQRLADEGHHVHVVTSRNPVLGDNVNTPSWLIANGLPFESFSFLGQKWRVRADVLIEDHFGTLVNFTNKNPGAMGVLLDQPWNRSPEATAPQRELIFRASDWTDVVSLVALAGME